jgi:hypothetical protein
MGAAYFLYLAMATKFEMTMDYRAMGLETFFAMKHGKKKDNPKEKRGLFLLCSPLLALVNFYVVMLDIVLKKLRDCSVVNLLNALVVAWLRCTSLSVGLRSGGTVSVI